MNDQSELRVLIAEDDYLVSKMIQGILKERGYSVVGEAGNGQEALDMVRSLRPDVVLMDIRMPDMDGLEATAQIQAYCPTPVVVLTAYETPELLKEATEAGVGAYLVKPPSGRELDRAISIAVARAGDIAELRRLNTELAVINEDLNAFAHTVAHDMRHLLSPILGYSEVLYSEHGHRCTPDMRQDLFTIAQMARNMSNLIDELMLLAQVREGEVKMHPLDIGSIVQEVQQRLGYLIEEKQAQIVVAKRWPKALGYESWVMEVWINYLSNAVKYGGELPFVELGWTPQEDGMICFWVRDYGPGIPPEKLVQLFKPFERPTQANLKGYGLGLSIVRRIVEKLGGEVGVESEVGMGSTFSFTLQCLPQE